MNQKEYIGTGSIDNLRDILDNYNTSMIFMVTGKQSYINCGADYYIKKTGAVNFTIFNNFENNPRIEDVKKGVKLFQESKADIILAIGGGSVIDMAKLIRYFSYGNVKNISIENIDSYKNVAINNTIRLIAIPTTAGSGSEATSFAVMYANKVKYSVSDNSILPDVVILDPLLSASLSAYNTAVSGMDVLCHSIESYWSINSTDESKSHAKKAMSICFDCLSDTVHNPNIHLRLNMLQAGNFAGKAINISKTTAAHALSYTLTSFFNIPHGLAAGLFIPVFLIYNFDVTESDYEDSRGVNYIKQTLLEIFQLLGEGNNVNAAFAFQKYSEKLGLSLEFSHYGIKHNDIGLILNNINNERLKNNPRKVDINELRKILESRVLQG